MNNQDYSIYIAPDNVDEIIEGLATLYFEIKAKHNISGHNFSLQNQKSSLSTLGKSSIMLKSEDIRHILKKALELKNSLLTDGQELSFRLNGQARITFIYSTS
ncbi:MAG: hypothetical protein ACK5MJ_07120 [Alphaproteobacteria bacterium]